MADKFGVNYTKAQITNPPAIVHQGENNGRVKVSFDSFKGAILINETIALMKLPKGARVLEAVMSHASRGAAGLYKLGLEGTIYRKANDATVSSAVTDASGEFIVHTTKNAAICKAMTTIAGQAGLHSLYVDANGAEQVESQVMLTCTEAPTTANVEVTVAVYYVID